MSLFVKTLNSEKTDWNFTDDQKTWLLKHINFKDLFGQPPKYPNHIRTQSRILASHVQHKCGLCISKAERDRLAVELNLPARIAEQGFLAVHHELHDMLSAEGF